MGDYTSADASEAPPTFDGKATLDAWAIDPEVLRESLGDPEAADAPDEPEEPQTAPTLPMSQLVTVQRDPPPAAEPTPAPAERKKPVPLTMASIEPREPAPSGGGRTLLYVGLAVVLGGSLGVVLLAVVFAVVAGLYYAG